MFLDFRRWIPLAAGDETHCCALADSGGLGIDHLHGGVSKRVASFTLPLGAAVNIYSDSCTAVVIAKSEGGQLPVESLPRVAGAAGRFVERAG